MIIIHRKPRKTFVSHGQQYQPKVIDWTQSTTVMMVVVAVLMKKITCFLNIDFWISIFESSRNDNSFTRWTKRKSIIWFNWRWTMTIFIWELFSIDKDRITISIIKRNAMMYLLLVVYNIPPQQLYGIIMMVKWYQSDDTRFHFVECFFSSSGKLSNNDNDLQIYITLYFIVVKIGMSNLIKSHYHHQRITKVVLEVAAIANQCILLLYTYIDTVLVEWVYMVFFSESEIVNIIVSTKNNIDDLYSI